jgi:Amidohydrolase
MDEALRALYAWCRSNEVPVMAHATPSNGPCEGPPSACGGPQNVFSKLTLARHWESVPASFPGIRLNFGHFGYTDLGNSRQEKLFSDYMARPSGQFLYADSAYITDALTQQTGLRAYLTSILQYSSGNGNAALAQRLMYGTDWEMIVREGPTSDRYLERFEAIFRSLDQLNLGAQGKLSDRFFGINAAIFLGLKKGQLNRNRLDAYYGNGPKPAWMSKVDGLALVA